MNHERVAALLSQGLKTGQVATIIGCSPSRISQLLASPEFQLILADKTAIAEKEFSESSALDAKYLNVEHSLLNAIEERIPSAELRDVTAALRTITERQYRKQQAQNPAAIASISQTNNIVQINIPSHITPQFTMNKENEIIAINEQTLAPLSSQGVEALFKRMKGEQDEPARIPASAEADADVTSSEEVLAQV